MREMMKRIKSPMLIKKIERSSYKTFDVLTIKMTKVLFDPPFWFIKFNTIDYMVILKLFLLNITTPETAQHLAEFQRIFKMEHKIYMMKMIITKLMSRGILINVNGSKHGAHQWKSPHITRYYLSKDGQHIAKLILGLENQVDIKTEEYLKFKD